MTRTYTMTLESANNYRDGTAYEIVLDIRNHKGDPVAKIECDFGGDDMPAQVVVRPGACAPCDPVYLQTQALSALYAEQERLDVQCLADVFCETEIVEF